MNNDKNKKIIIGIIVVLIIILPISIFAITKLIELPPTDEASIAELNRKDREKQLEKKAEYAEEHKNDIVENNKLNNGFSEEELARFEKERQENEKKENEIKNIMNRYYEKEFAKILEDVEKSTSNRGAVEINSAPISPEEIRLFDIILRVLEEKDLSNEDKNILKNFIEQQEYLISKDSSLKTRADKILQ